MNSALDTIEPLFSDTHGIYIPQRFIRDCGHLWQGIDPKDAAILEYGPGHEHYWNAWDDVCKSAFIITSNGEKYTLHMDSDLFAVSEKHIWED